VLAGLKVLLPASAASLEIRPAVHAPKNEQEDAPEQDIDELCAAIGSRQRTGECESGEHCHRSHNDVPALILRVTQLHDRAMPSRATTQTVPLCPGIGADLKVLWPGSGRPEVRGSE
jgi:hypothetical protein